MPDSSCRAAGSSGDVISIACRAQQCHGPRKGCGGCRNLNTPPHRAIRSVDRRAVGYPLPDTSSGRSPPRSGGPWEASVLDRCRAAADVGQPPLALLRGLHVEVDRELLDRLSTFPAAALHEPQTRRTGADSFEDQHSDAAGTTW